MEFWDFLSPVVNFALGGVALVIGGVMIGWLQRSNMDHRDAWIAATRGVIRPNRLQYLLFGGLGLILTGGFAFFARYSVMIFIYEQLWLAVPGIVIFGAMTWMMISMAVFPSYRVTWNDHSLTGPASHWFPPFGPGRATLNYHELTEIGSDWTDSFYVGGPNGEKIRWSYLYKGFGALNEQIALQRPDLFDDDD